ncbi:MAG: YpdA family putative bacillithiol disulfide reductase [Bacteroidota bacterium]
MTDQVHDVLIVGGGPCGLACAIEAKAAGLDVVVLEKGSIAESIRRYPRQMTFFSTPENIAIGQLPFPTVGAKASRNEALKYYRLAADHYGLDLRLYTEVRRVKRYGETFSVTTTGSEEFRAHNVVIATGYFDFPRPLNIPGIDSPRVTRYYDEAHPYARSRVTIIGGGNSATEAALDLYRSGAEVTILVREEGMKPTVKYWLTKDIQNRIGEGSIKLLTRGEATRITPQAVAYRDLETGAEKEIPSDFVLVLIGYLPETGFYQQLGIPYDPESLIPEYDPETYSTPVPGLYLAGTVIAGVHTEKVFIENGRLHGTAIVRDILQNQPATVIK